MAFLTEDALEQAAIAILEKEMGYSHLFCLHTEQLGRSSRRQVFAVDRLRAALQRLNPGYAAEQIEQAVEEISRERDLSNLFGQNCDFYRILKHGIEIKIRGNNNRDEIKTLRLLDYQDPQQNDFVVVSQLWIESPSGPLERRPDLLIYINGMPLVFIELKRSDKELRLAYDDNLLRYRDRIPQLFIPNVACVLSNGAEAKIGAYCAGYSHFFDWLRTEEAKDNPNQPSKQQIRAQKAGLDYLIRSFLKKETLLDYIEHFVLYNTKQRVKVIAKNHQYIGVNNAIAAYEANRNTNKIGTFWHTQGSGKSFSMVFFTEKLRRQCVGDFTFLMITDRKDLDKQLYENYVDMGVVNSEKEKNAERVRPRSSQELRDFLQHQNKRYIFTLIQGFGSQGDLKHGRYPLLSDRKDIIVVVDEAHRTQYANLADNMRIGLPHAQYIAFTGTPLIKNEITEQYFGEVISEYNFAQSIEDQATVPLYYSRRVPTVIVAGDQEQLQDEYLEILESEDLTAEQIEQLERKFVREFEVIKRDDRLETIAKDIVAHFPHRGYKGKGMVVSVDKYTAVRMYDKVQYHWDEAIKKLQKDLRKASDAASRKELEAQLQFMKETEMAVIISAEDGEEEKFELKKLVIKPHRDRMNAEDAHGQSIEDHFKAPDHPLRLVFVCAMWLTGFDAPTVSTIYLDKPMQQHTLMQTIARANRVTAYTIDGVAKICGQIIDYYGVFRNLRQALSVYAQGSQTSGVQVEEIVKPSDFLKNLLLSALEQGEAFSREQELDLEAIRTETNKLEVVKLLEAAADTLLSNDEIKRQFNVYQSTISDLFAACKPEILTESLIKSKVSLWEYLRHTIDRKRQIGDIARASERVSDLLDHTVLVEEEGARYEIAKPWIIDLSKLDYQKLQEEFKQMPHKHIAIADIREFIEQKLQKMLQANPTRKSFVERYQQLVDGYNEGNFSAEDLMGEFTEFIQSLAEEEQRSIKENLSEEELVLFDLLSKPNPSKNEREKIKQAARALLQRLRDQQNKLLVVDWEKTSETRMKVEQEIGQVLKLHLPRPIENGEEGYSRSLFQEKCQQVFEFICVEYRRFVG